MKDENRYTVKGGEAEGYMKAMQSVGEKLRVAIETDKHIAVTDLNLDSDDARYVFAQWTAGDRFVRLSGKFVLVPIEMEEKDV